MSTVITCPKCKTQFEAEAGIAQSIKDDLTNEYNRKWADLQKQKEEQFRQQEKQKEEQYRLAEKQKEDQYRQKELQWQEQERKNQELTRQREQQFQQQQNEMAKKLEEDKKLMETRLTQELSVKVGADFEHKLKMLEEANVKNEAKLTEARQKEMEFLKAMQELKTKEQEMELEMQRKMMDERQKLSEVIKKEEEEKNKLKDAEYQLVLKEKEKQMDEQRRQLEESNKLRDTEFQMKLMEKDKLLDDQRKLVEEMKRKSEQGSMQLQGEVMELALEQLLANAFPFDLISEVGKGVRGADCIQTVRNNFGNVCGKIIFESKRTKDFSQDWIEKLKADMRVLGADVAVIVTQAMPKDMTNFGEKDGIWICTFGEVRALVHVLRELVIKVYNATKSQENKGDKMTLLYTYLVSGEFSEQWSAIREGFMGMKMSIAKERDQMEKMWKAREKQLEKVLLNAAHIRGSIEGISGMDVDLNLLPTDKDTYLLD